MSSKCAPQQQRFEVLPVVIDPEECLGVVKPFAERKPVLIPFASITAGVTQEKTNEDIAGRGTRQRAKATKGNLDVQPSLSIPLDSNILGLFLRGSIDKPALEYIAEPNAMIGAPKITIVSFNYEFSVAQTFLTDGDEAIVVFLRDGQVNSVVIIADSSNPTTEGELAIAATGPMGNDISNAEVLAIIPNSPQVMVDFIGSVWEDSLTISSGEFILTSDSGIEVGDKLFVATLNNWLTVVSITQEWDGTDIRGTMVDAYGKIPEDSSPASFLAIAKPGAKFAHVYKAPDRQRLPSLFLQAQFDDIVVPFFESYTGTKNNEMQLTMGEDGELRATINMMGLDFQRGYKPYDAADHAATVKGTITIAAAGAATTTSSHTNAVVGDFIVYRQTDGTLKRVKITEVATATSFIVRNADDSVPATTTAATVVEIYSSVRTAIRKEGQQFTNPKAKISIDQIEGEITTAEFQLNNNIDGETYTATGTGKRGGLNEGFLDITGSFTSLLRDERIPVIGDGDADVPMRFENTAANGDKVIIELPLTEHDKAGVSAEGPGGVVYTSTYKSHGAEGVPQVTVTLLNEWSAYN